MYTHTYIHTAHTDTVQLFIALISANGVSTCVGAYACACMYVEWGWHIVTVYRLDSGLSPCRQFCPISYTRNAGCAV